MLQNLEEQILKFKDDLEINGGKVPKYHLQAHKELIKEEEMAYAESTN
jgi:hypothetical protein